jgi:4,5-DOPA dioxygenase extradiol
MPLDARRPMDHGVWVPLIHMFPDHDVPVVQLSMPSDWTPRKAYETGSTLSDLRADGVLVIGSGSMTHNLSHFSGMNRQIGDAPLPYVAGFSSWIKDVLQRQDREQLFDYQDACPFASTAHPTDEHLLPLMFAAGAGDWGTDLVVPVNYITEEIQYGILAMDSILFG